MENKSYIKNFILMLSGNTFSQLIPFFAASFLARIYLPSEFGMFSNVLALSTLFGIVSCGRLELAIPLPQSERNSQDIVFTAGVFTVVISAISSLSYIFSDFVGWFYNDHNLSAYLAYVPFCVFSFGMMGVTNQWILRQKKYKVLTFIKIGQSVINNFAALIFGFIGFGIHGLVIAWLLSQYIPAIYILLHTKIGLEKDRMTWNVFKETVLSYRDFPLINSLHAFTDIFATQVVIFWIIAKFYGDDMLGLYAQMNKYVKAPIVLVTSSVSQIFYVSVSKAIQDGLTAKKYVIQTLKTTIWFAIPFVIILFFFAEQMFSFYFGKKFIDYGIAGSLAIKSLPLFFMMFLVSPISGIPILFKKQKIAFLISILGYGFSLFSMYLFSYFKFTIQDAILIQSVTFSMYLLVLLIWYYSLINRYDAHIN